MALAVQGIFDPARKQRVDYEKLFAVTALARQLVASNQLSILPGGSIWSGRLRSAGVPRVVSSYTHIFPHLRKRYRPGHAKGPVGHPLHVSFRKPLCCPVNGYGCQPSGGILAPSIHGG